MTESEKRLYAEAIKASLGFSQPQVVMGPPMEVEEICRWFRVVPPRRCRQCGAELVEAGPGGASEAVARSGS